jgi:predicted Ser/Thr protein kinase
MQGLCPDCLQAATVEPAAPRPGPAFAPPQPAALSGLFPQLEILGSLGHGGMGAVYKARQRGLGRLVALKVLPPEISGLPGFAERFAREAQALARLSHANVVSVFDLGQSGALYYFLMEFVDGVNLRQLLHSRRLTPRESLAILQQVCEGLEYAHDEGVVHRDIKPENILLDSRTRVKIADFGLSRLLGPREEAFRLTQSDQVMGTMHYMAPEQFEQPRGVDHRADIYALGVVLYEMLTGELPLGRFELPSKKAAVDPRVDEIVLRALERHPGRRYQRVAEIRLQLEAIAGVSSKLSPEASRRLSYEYRSKATLFGWPLLHVVTGVDPVTGRKRSARGIIAMGTAPCGVVAFGDVAVGVIACGVFGYGVVSVSVVAVGLISLGSVAVGLWLAMGGMAVGLIAMGGAAFGYYACGALVWGPHAIGPGAHDLLAEQFFNPTSARLTTWIFRACLVATPLFLALGCVPSLMAKVSERRTRKACAPAPAAEGTAAPAGWAVRLRKSLFRRARRPGRR